MAPALAFMVMYLVYPFAGTLWLALWEGHLAGLLHAPEVRGALLNTLAWLAVVPGASVLLGLIFALLSDGLRWGGVVRALVFLPAALSFVTAAVIWKFVYANSAEVGLLNAVRMALGATAPVDVLQWPFWNTLFLMLVMIWSQTGFAMVLLAAALAAIPAEVRLAAKACGAGQWRQFWRITLPLLAPAMAMVWTVLALVTLKTFDIVYAMTGGNFGTHVLPSLMMRALYRDEGRAAGLAVMIALLAVPLIAWGGARLCRGRA